MLTEEDDNGVCRVRHAINVGSVSKPKDADPRGCWMLLRVAENPDPADADSVDAEFVRVSYDVDQAVRGVEESPLPDAFAQMLQNGK